MFHRASDRFDRPALASAVRRRGSTLLAALLASTLVLIVVPASAFAAAPARKLTPLQRGLAFYRGKTVTMLTYGPAGSGVDLTARFLVPVMSQYLHASVQIENLPTANGISEQDALARATPNGLTFGQLNVATDISAQLTNTAALNFNPVRLAFLGSSPSGSSVWVSNPTSQYTSWKRIQTATSPVTMLDTSTGDSNLRLRAVNGVFGINANIITGYTNTAALTQGFVRGDGPIIESALSVIAPLILSGAARPILLTTHGKFSAALSAKLQGVPTLSQIAVQYPPKNKQKIKALSALLGLLKVGTVNAAPTATPSDRLLALRAAFEFASKNKTVQSQVLTAGSMPGWISGPAAKSYWVSISNNTAPLAVYVNG